MSILCVSLFGKFHAQLGEQILTSLNACKVQELFSYLLLYRNRPHPRETLASLLWGDSSTAQSKSYLRKALWQLQTALSPQTEPFNGPLLLVKPNWIQLNPEANLWLDVAAFEQAFTFVQGVRGQELDFRQVLPVLSAVGLYQGYLLEICHQEWCLYERERFQHMYLAMLDKLMGYCEAHHEHEAGLICGTVILRYDRAHERTHWRMMRLHYLAGDRTAALRQYEQCVAALDEELDVRPAKRTVALYEQIRSDQLCDLTLAPAKAITTPEVLVFPLPEVLERLKQRRGVLANLQLQIQQDIHTVEQALESQY